MRPRGTAGPYLSASRPALSRAAAPTTPAEAPPAHSEHEALAAAATIATPALWVAVVTQAPAGSARGLVLAVGWVGLASLLNRRRPKRTQG